MKQDLHVANWTEVGQPHAHESAVGHVTGTAPYTDDLPELYGTLHAALGLSEYAHAEIVFLDVSAVRDSPGVVAVLTAGDIPGVNNCGPIIADDPVLADRLVEYLGQPIFIVVADSHENARRAARKAQIVYEPLPAILTPQQAKASRSLLLPSLRLTKGDFQQSYDGAAHRLTGELFVGGQEHFYLEGQIAYAVPTEQQGLLVQCSTQAPTDMQHLIAQALNLDFHHVVVECRRMGGGFGGKESQSALWAIAASVCAVRLNRPVKLRASRSDDMLVTGKRHCFHYEYKVGYNDDGRILAIRIEMISRGGFSADLSGAVATRAVLHADNTYFLSDVDITAMCGKTNTQSSTAFRGFGSPQGVIIIEYVIDDIARALGKDPLSVRKANFYGAEEATGRAVTHYGQPIRDNVIHELVAQLERSSDYTERRRKILAFNARSAVLKKGIAMVPLKFGIAFAATQWNQAGALVHVYRDGTVIVNHGGTEMGQGLNTKVAQVVAHELGVSLEKIRVTATDTSKVPNTSPTAASTGTDLNGRAAQNAAQTIRLRLAEVVASGQACTPSEVRFLDNHAHVNGSAIPFPEVVEKAYAQRVQLWSDGFYATPDIHWDPVLMTGEPYSYFAYGAAVAEVVIDILSGEWKLLGIDVLHDVGRSLNPAIDIGQIEGGLIQGVGWLTTEQLFWNEKGMLTTHGPSTYKIPAISDYPARFNVTLFDNKNLVENVHYSKAVGEPPLVLGTSVFFALRDAIASTRQYRHRPPLDAPATSEAILHALQNMPTDVTVMPDRLDAIS